MSALPVPPEAVSVVDGGATATISWLVTALSPSREKSAADLVNMYAAGIPPPDKSHWTMR